MKETKRALRRAKMSALKNKIKRRYKSLNYTKYLTQDVIDNIVNHEWQNPKVCSCRLCQNVRRATKKQTKQEIFSDMKLKEELNDILEEMKKEREKAVLTKIQMILSTKEGELLDESDLGMDLEDYFFNEE